MPEEMCGNPEKKEGNPSAVPESEISIDFVRSSGPGGQKVNKTSSKAQLRWHIGSSEAFTEEQKDAIRRAAGGRLNADDEVVLSSDVERSQIRNREDVIRRLQKLVTDALTPRKERKPTKVSKAQKQKRLDEKRKRGEQKKLRKKPSRDG